MKTVRRPPYPKWNPGYFPCSSLTPPSAFLTPSIGGFGLRARSDEEELSSRLPEAARLHRDMKSWVEGPGIRYGTYHSAKGLEFDMVILPFFSDEHLPDHGEIDAQGQEEAEVQDGRLLYVGVTRAKSRLVMTYTGDVTRLLPAAPGLYETLSICASASESLPKDGGSPDSVTSHRQGT